SSVRQTQLEGHSASVAQARTPSGGSSSRRQPLVVMTTAKSRESARTSEAPFEGDRSEAHRDSGRALVTPTSAHETPYEPAHRRGGAHADHRLARDPHRLRTVARGHELVPARTIGGRRDLVHALRAETHQ